MNKKVAYKSKQTGSDLNHFNLRDPHPNPLFKDFVFRSYVKNPRKDGTHAEHWMHKSKVPTLTKEESLKKRHKMSLQTGSERGHFKYKDKHPDREDYCFQCYRTNPSGKLGEFWKHIDKWPSGVEKTINKQTGSRKGHFKYRAPHPTIEGWLFYVYSKRQKKGGGFFEIWHPTDSFPPTKEEWLAENSNATDKPRGFWKRFDKHPNNPNLFFNSYIDSEFGKGWYETWWPSEKHQKHTKNFDAYIDGSKQRMRRNSIREGFLTDLSDPENIYILGLLWADGSLPKEKKNYKTKTVLQQNTISFVQTEDDFPDDLFIKNGIYSIHRAIHKPYTARNGKTYCGRPSKQVTFSSHLIRQFLEENDYHLKSSSGDPRKILSLIPDDIKHYWWRGFLDGDGCVYFNEEKPSHLSPHKILFTSHFSQNWRFVEDLCQDLEISKPSITAGQRYSKTEDGKRVRNGKSSNANIYCFLNNFKLGSYIWPDDELDIGLSRKFDKWKKIKNLLPVFLERERTKYTYFHNQSQKWRVQITHKSKTLAFKGGFKTECDAIAWRDEHLEVNNLNYLIEN